MRKTPQPWSVGSEGVIAPSVPYRESSHYDWDLSWKLRGYVATSSSLTYQGELVCEGGSFEDNVLIVQATRALPLLLETLRSVGEMKDLSEVKALVTAAHTYVVGLRSAIEEEGKSNRERGVWAQSLVWAETIKGYLPETATRARLEPPAPPYSPLRYVTDNIEIAWERSSSNQI